MESGEKVNILLVDDHPANLLALSAILNHPDYNLVTALSGLEALKQLHLRDFAVVLLDVMMPEMDGFQTAKLMKDRDSARHVPIIFVTAVATEPKDVYRGYSLGAVDYIQKPLDVDVVRGKVAVFVELFRKTQEVQRQDELIRNSERAQFLEREQAARFKAEAAEERFRSLVNALDHAIIWESSTDLSRLSFVSSQVDKLLGYPHERWIKERDFFLAHVHPDDRTRLLRILVKTVGENGSEMGERVEHRLIAADGSEHWFHTGIQKQRGPGGTPLNIRGLSVDISASKAVEQALRDSQDRLNLALNAAQMGMWDWNLITGSVVWSNILQRIFGYIPGEFPGTIEGFWERVHPEDRDRVKAAQLASLEKGSDYECEYRVVWQDGSIHWVHSRGHAFKDSSQRTVRMSGTGIDVTSRKKIEHEKEKLLRELQGAVRAREEVVAIVAHDLKNPLSSAALSSDMLLRLLERENKSDLKTQAQRIKNSIERMTNLTQDILDVTKVEAGRFMIRPHMENAEAIVSEAVEMLQPIAAGKQITLRTEVSPVQVSCDYERMIQVFSNLISNAIKFSPEGTEIWIRSESFADNQVCFSVQDFGGGISEEERPHIFDRYWQAQSSSKRGIGLGLYIAKGIIEAHHGRIWVKSTPGKGSVFFFTLPKAMPQAQSA